MNKGSQPHTTVVTPAFFSFASFSPAWIDIWLTSRRYFSFSTGCTPAELRMRTPAATHSWYQEFSGAMMPTLRG